MMPLANLLLLGLILMVGYIIYLRATLRSIGGAGENRHGTLSPPGGEPRRHRGAGACSAVCAAYVRHEQKRVHALHDYGIGRSIDRGGPLAS